MTRATTDTSRTGLRGHNTKTLLPWLPLARAEYVIALSLCAVCSSLLSAIMGRDPNWDYLHYHAYAASTALHERPQDFFAAGYQGYLHPLPYLPLALMQKAGWHSLLISAGLASIHSLNVFFTYLISRELCREASSPRLVAAVITVTGVVSSAFVGLIGNSFAELMTTPPVLAAVWLLIARPRLSTTLLACALVGLAVGMKLTNVVFAAAALVAATWRVATLPMAHQRRDRAVALLACCVAMLSGFVVIYGHWGWQLYNNFGSPFFPLFNDFFRAPDYPAQALLFHRFVPQTVEQLLSLPFRMLRSESWVYAEIVAPDVRPAVALLLAALVLARWLTSAWGSRPSNRPLTTPTDERLLLVFFLVATILWLATSGNARYAAPLLLLLGPVVFVLARRLCGVRAGAAITLLVACVQSFLFTSAGNPRWAPSDWTSDWLPASVPEELSASPMLFVTIGRSAESHVADVVHPDSAFVNPIGLVSIPTDGPGWPKFLALLTAYEGRTRVNFRYFGANPSGSEYADITPISKSIATMVDRLGLVIDPQRCAMMTFGAAEGLVIPYLWSREEPSPDHLRRIVSCPAKRSPTPSSALHSQREVATAVMNALEARCPSVFSPAGVQLEFSGTTWLRYYGKFDLYARLEFETGGIVYSMERQGPSARIGNIRTWQQDIAAMPCALPFGGKRGIELLDSRAAR